jgi:hypothetical protein
LRRGLLLLGLLLSAGSLCARETYQARPSLIPPGSLVLFYFSKGPLSSNPSTRKDLPPDAVLGEQVFGKTCQYGLSVPLSLSLRSSSLSGAIGDGGYRKTIEKMKKDHPELLGLFDVKVDLHITSILGFYRRLCTEVTGQSLIRSDKKIKVLKKNEKKVPPAFLER